MKNYLLHALLSPYLLALRWDVIYLPQSKWVQRNTTFKSKARVKWKIINAFILYLLMMKTEMKKQLHLVVKRENDKNLKKMHFTSLH